MIGMTQSRTPSWRSALAATMMAASGIAAAQEGYIDFGIGGVAGYNSFEDILATSMLLDESTTDGLVLQAEDGSVAVLELDVVVGPRGLVDGTVDAVVGDGDPSTDDEVTYSIPVAGRTQYRSRTLVSTVTTEAEDGTETTENVSTTHSDNAFAIVARRENAETASPIRLRIAGRERFTTHSDGTSVGTAGFRTVLGLELEDGRIFHGIALVDGLGKAQANILTTEEAFVPVNAGATVWVGDSPVNTTWQDTYVEGGITMLALMTRPRPEGPTGPGGGGGHHSKQPTASTNAGNGRFHLSQHNVGYHGRLTGQIILPVVEEGAELPAPIDLERVPKSMFFSTPSAITTVQHVNALPSTPGGGGKH